MRKRQEVAPSSATLVLALHGGEEGRGVEEWCILVEWVVVVVVLVGGTRRSFTFPIKSESIVHDHDVPLPSANLLL